MRRRASSSESSDGTRGAAATAAAGHSGRAADPGGLAFPPLGRGQSDSLEAEEGEPPPWRDEVEEDAMLSPAPEWEAAAPA